MTPELPPPLASHQYYRTKGLREVTLNRRPPTPESETSFEEDAQDSTPSSPYNHLSHQTSSTAAPALTQQRQRSRTGSSHQVVPVHLKDPKVLQGLRDLEVTRTDLFGAYDNRNLI